MVTNMVTNMLCLLQTSSVRGVGLQKERARDEYTYKISPRLIEAVFCSTSNKRTLTRRRWHRRLDKKKVASDLNEDASGVSTVPARGGDLRQ